MVQWILISLYVLLPSTINLINGKECKTGIPTETISTCFSIASKPNQFGNECAKDDSCSVLVTFNSLDMDEDNTTSIVKVTIIIDRLYNISILNLRLNQICVVLNITLDKKTFDGGYIRLKCSDRVGSNSRHNLRDLSIQQFTHRRNGRLLICEYELKSTIGGDDRSLGSFDPRNDHYLELSYGYHTGYNTSIVLTRKISSNAYRFAEYLPVAASSRETTPVPAVPFDSKKVGEGRVTVTSTATEMPTPVSVYTSRTSINTYRTTNGQASATTPLTTTKTEVLTTTTVSTPIERFTTVSGFELTKTVLIVCSFGLVLIVGVVAYLACSTRRPVLIPVPTEDY